MATVTKTVGTDSRDYSTMALWDADLDDNTIYSSGDTARGEFYNDSVFTVGVSNPLGGTLGLDRRILEPAEGEEHDGTAGVGVRFVVAVAQRFYYFNDHHGVSNTIKLIEIDCDEAERSYPFYCSGLGGDLIEDYYQQLIFHDHHANNGHGNMGFTTNTDGVAAGSEVHLLNSLFYDIRGDLSQTVCIENDADATGRTLNIIGNTIDRVSINTAAQNIDGIRVEQYGTYTNNVVTQVTSPGTANCFDGVGTESHNASDDATADGTGSLTSITPADQFTSLTDGSEDYTPKSGADIIDAGTDLATTPTGVNLDLKGRDRDAEGDTWDMGAIESIPSLAFPFQLYYDGGPSL